VKSRVHVDQLRITRCDKSILVIEVGCAEAGGRKGDWICRMADLLNHQHDVMRFWRMTSSSASAAAMARALRNARFAR
jgi:mannan endo-1,4-beta-mannosidase